MGDLNAALKLQETKLGKLRKNLIDRPLKRNVKRLIKKMNRAKQKISGNGLEAKLAKVYLVHVSRLERYYLDGTSNDKKPYAFKSLSRCLEYASECNLSKQFSFPSGFFPESIQLGDYVSKMSKSQVIEMVKNIKKFDLGLKKVSLTGIDFSVNETIEIARALKDADIEIVDFSETLGIKLENFRIQKTWKEVLEQAKALKSYGIDMDSIKEFVNTALIKKGLMGCDDSTISEMDP